VPAAPPLTKVKLFAARGRDVGVKPPPTLERVALSGPPEFSILQTVSPPALKRPREVRLSAATVADREMGTVGLAFRKAATDPAETVKETPVGPGPGKPEKFIVTVAIVFPLNDLFESEEFDNLPPDYHIPGKKMQLFFWGLVSWIILGDKHLLG
jgi:hypothetical protein